MTGGRNRSFETGKASFENAQCVERYERVREQHTEPARGGKDEEDSGGWLGRVTADVSDKGHSQKRAQEPRSESTGQGRGGCQSEEGVRARAVEAGEEGLCLCLCLLKEIKAKKQPPAGTVPLPLPLPAGGEDRPSI